MSRNGRTWGWTGLAVGVTAGLLTMATAPGPAAGAGVPGSAVTAGPTPGSPTPTVTPGCASRPTSATYRYASPTVLTFGYQTPGVPDCPGSRATIQVFADAAARRPIAVVTTPATSLSGAVRLPNLTPGTAYYYRIATGKPAVTGPIQGPVSTQPAGTPPASVVCDVRGGLARVTERTTTRVTFQYTAPQVLGCDLPGHPWLSTRLTIWSDPDGLVEVARTSAPAGSTAGVLTVGRLSPGTMYYYRFEVLNAFVQDMRIYPVSTPGAITPTPSTPAPTGTYPPSGRPRTV
jgi:hypothetical protein